MRRWSKAIVIATIRQLQRSDGKLNCGYIQVYRRPLYLAACVYCGGWRKAIEAAGISYDRVRIKQRVRPKWGRENVIAAIRRLDKDGKPLNSNFAQTRIPALYGAAVTYCGSWGAAVTAAGYEYDQIRLKAAFRAWSRAEIIKAIQRRHRTGLPVNAMSIYRGDRGLYAAAKRTFGKLGVQKALRRAGFNPQALNPLRTWSRSRVLREIRRLVRQNVRPYGYHLRNIGNGGLVSAGCKLLGSWKKAIEAAGYDYADVRGCRYYWWNRRRVIAEIKRLERSGVRLSSKDMQRAHGDLFGAAIAYFGSWSQAVEAADINYRLHTKTWSYKAWMRQLTPRKLMTIKHRMSRFAAQRRLRR